MKHRLVAVLPLYFALYCICYYCAFLLRFDFEPSAGRIAQFWNTLPFVLLIKAMVCGMTGEWRRTLRYATLADMLWIIAGASLAVPCVYGLNSLELFERQIPQSVIIIDTMLTILASGLLRTMIRYYEEILRPWWSISGNERRGREATLIYGIDSTAINLYRAVKTAKNNFRTVGFVTDESRRHRKTLLAGVPVFSIRLGWKRLCKKLRVSHLLIPSTLSGKRIRQLLQYCSDSNVKAHVIPAVDEIVSGRYKLTIRDVNIADLLRREPADLDRVAIQGYVTGRRVLVTGAAGSIGSELCRQILDLNPAELIFVDQSEFGMFSIEQELKEIDTSVRTHFVLADVVDENSMRRVMVKFRPELVFHAAAYKHVPLMEDHPQEAIRNNILGTKTVVDLADEFRVQRFVMISTDKAVRPTSIMGSSKLVAEKYLQAVSERSSTQFITVRFGNVLNSAGSVVPTFRRQIEAGGPITVTHPDMVRFFMTIPEAVQLVLQAGAIGTSGDVLILDMGEPVKIVDLAKDMIFLSGLKFPEDIDIVFTGMRPGEKLYEELFYSAEQGAVKVHDKIFCARREPISWDEIVHDMNVLKSVIYSPAPEARNVLTGIVDRFVAEEVPQGHETDAIPSTQRHAA
ncbi:MAG: nucleoside-diphosphate sugar epimerase/dehydratase [Planctomycetota bacterium]|nr:nucleoside-diphosphate sugar epimerase/dehydratase [Planctomycetota bacterium]MDA1213090.1 nucleoside-diphosphate sugar epimerase/dehydratase [Planctomycetota bacterium]